MEKEKITGLIRTFDTGELSTELIPPHFTDPDVLFEILIKTVSNYHPSSDLEIITKAYELAKDAHKEQKRKSGEPYLIHPVCVAIILAQLEMDKETIVGGLLHDVVEDTKYTTQDLTEMFSAEIATLVDGVTKLTQLNYDTDKVERQAENLRKMFLAMAKDIRVITDQTGRPSPQYAHHAVYEAGEAERKVQRDHGHLCADCRPAWYFQE